MTELERDLHIYDRLLEAVDQQVERSRSDLQFFLVLNASIVAGGLATLQFVDKPQVALLALIAFAGGFGLVIAALHVSRNNKKYYRVLVAKRVLMERKLGLTDDLPGYETSNVAIMAVSAVATKTKIREILADPDEYTEPHIRAGSNSDWGQWTLRGFGVFHLLAALILSNAAAGCVLPAVPCA